MGWTSAALFAWIFAAPVVDGSCVTPTEPALAALSGVLAAAGCLPESDPRRPAAEEQELRALEDSYVAFVRDTCRAKRCISNAWGVFVDVRDYEESYRHVMAGCISTPKS